MTTESKAKPVYKKTDRTRNVDKHKHLDIVADALRANLEIVLGRAITVNVTRSEERRYARALFKVTIGDSVVDGKTMEEVLQLAEGVKLVSEMKESA